MNFRVALDPVEILIVEDSPSDALLTREAFQGSRVRHNLYVVSDGIEALAFLRHEGPYAAVPRPDLILMDWRLPKKDGCELLAEIKADANLQDLLVIILSTSQDPRDIHTAYSHHANCYIAKPSDFQRFIEVVKDLEHFWCSVAMLPTHRSKPWRKS
jgi:two-component system, chemotaxis family, response regulator Rcp1